MNKTPSGETCSEGYVLPVVYENQVICTVMLYQVDIVGITHYLVICAKS